MASGLSDAVVNRALNKILGATADNTILAATIYLDLDTTSASDDNGTDVVSWGQGRVAVAVVNGTNWPAAAGRAKIGATFVLPANASGLPIDVESFSWWTASSGGTYLGGAPLPGGTQTIEAGAVPNLTPTLSSPAPS